MRGIIGAVVAAAVAIVSAAGMAVWVKLKKDEREAGAGVSSKAHVPGKAHVPAKAIDAEGVPGARGQEAAADGADDLTALKGIGAVSQERLEGIGVTTFAQIAAWDDEELESVAARIKVSPERIRREDWVGQAKAVVEG